jgi:hypothetical protein
MISFDKRKKIKRKLILPLVLILVLVGGILFFNFKSFNFSFDWSDLFPSSHLIRPIPEENLEEEIKEKLVPLRLNLQSLDDSDEREIIATFSGNLTVIFSKEKDLRSQVTSLQFILWRTKIEGKLPYLVDFRFNKPIIKN